jgi:hypothetical protein
LGAPSETDEKEFFIENDLKGFSDADKDYKSIENAVNSLPSNSQDFKKLPEQSEPTLPPDTKSPLSPLTIIAGIAVGGFAMISLRR